ncbi:MAG: ABC transporter ATP-binding protein [Streptosporangiaceae bacterium]
MTAVLEARELGKRYRRRWALSECTLSIPTGRVAGLVGPNGAGKTTLLHLAVGLLRPTVGTITVLGHTPAADPQQLARVGFVAQDSPTYAALSVADHLRLGAHLDPGWDARLARDRIERIGLDPAQRAGKLSGGQRAQLALTLAIAKRPELLILDEPVAALDPLARHDFLQDLTETVAEHRLSVVMSSHLVADLQQVCDYLVVLTAGRVQVAGPLDDLLSTHRLVAGAASADRAVPPDWQIISARRSDHQTTFIVRADEPIQALTWTVSTVDMEDLVLAYLSQAAEHSRRTGVETQP